MLFLIINPLVSVEAKSTVHGVGVNPTFGVFYPKEDGNSSILLEQGIHLGKNLKARIYHPKKKKMLAWLVRLGSPWRVCWFLH